MGPFSQSWARIWRLIKRSATRINLMWQIPERRTCSSPPPSSLRARARADDGIPIRFVIEKKQQNCGPKSRNRIVAWLKYTGSPAVLRKQLPNKRKPTVSIRGSENSSKSTSHVDKSLVFQARQRLIGCNYFCP